MTVLFLSEELERARRHNKKLHDAVERSKDLLAVLATEFQHMTDVMPMPHQARARAKYLEIKEAIGKLDLDRELR